MTDLHADVLDEIRRVARSELGFEGAVEDSHALRNDLRLDSLGMVLVAVALEDRFRVRLHEEDAARLDTVGDLVALVCRRVGEQRAPGASA
jgi:acyl carrier protein